MSIFTKNDMEKRMAHALRLQQDGVCLTWVQQQEDYCWLNPRDTQTQIRQFKKLLQKGTIEVSPRNNKEFTYKGKKWFSLVIQPTNENDQQQYVCPSMLLIFRYMVSGYGYMFSNKQNRDKMYEWLVAKKKVQVEVVPDPPAVKARRRKRKRCEANDPPADPPTYNGVFDYPTNEPPCDIE